MADTEFFPGDVITIGLEGEQESAWKLIVRRNDTDDNMQLWRAEPLTVEHAFANQVWFFPEHVTKVVPGWRAGQRRRVLPTKAHPAFEGIVSPPPSGYATPPPAGAWVIARADGCKFWAMESEPSELLEEASAPDGSAVAHLRREFPDIADDDLTLEVAKAIDEQNAAIGEAVASLCKQMGVDTALRWPRDAKKGEVVTLRRPAPDVNADAAMVKYREQLDKYTREAMAAGGAAPIVPAITRVVTLPGEVTMMPVTFVIPPPDPLREVSPNGRDWVDYASLTDADPFESYGRRRVNGTEVRAEVAICARMRPADGEPGGFAKCGREAKRRVKEYGEVMICDEHHVIEDELDRSNTDNKPGQIDAYNRMLEMGRSEGVGRNRQPVPVATAYPRLFGGIWRTR